MMCAFIPLLGTELAEAVSIDDNAQYIGVTDEELLLICSNFIVRDPTGHAQFAHVSVREYLERRKARNVLEFSAELAHAQAAITCFAYYNHPRSSLKKKIIFGFDFSGYAALFWLIHIASVPPQNRRRLLQNVHASFLFEIRGKSIRWLV